MRIRIADKNSDADALAHLFTRNIDPNYISHSELQGGRALAPDRWAPELQSLVREEIRERLKEPLRQFPGAGNWRGVLEAWDKDALIGMALVTVTHEATVPFGIVEDIVVETKKRGAGFGAAMMKWAIDALRNAGLKRVFLESGGQNEAAHRLFEQLGFRTVSIVMAKDL